MVVELNAGKPVLKNSWDHMRGSSQTRKIYKKAIPSKNNILRTFSPQPSTSFYSHKLLFHFSFDQILQASIVLSEKMMNYEAESPWQELNTDSNHQR